MEWPEKGLLPSPTINGGHLTNFVSIMCLPPRGNATTKQQQEALVNTTTTTIAVDPPRPAGDNNIISRGGYYPRHFYFSKDKASAPYLTPLNDKVEAIAARHLAKAKAAASLPPHVLLQADGAFVYPRRYRALPLVFVIAACYLITLSPNYYALCLSVILLYFEIDFYSGILHIVLDNPLNLGRSTYILEAVMFQGCLEFQWHHEIPRDIVYKGLLSSCADLNVVVMANMIAVALVHGLPSITTMMMTNITNIIDDNTTTTTDKQNLLWSIMGLKLLYGYFGQYNHLMAHTSPTARPALVKVLQHYHIMLDDKKHNGHHRTYDENFCLLGHMDWAVNAVDKCIDTLISLLHKLSLLLHVGWFPKKHYVWFALWMGMSIFCLPNIITPIVRYITT
jgi:hypothetical protein